MTTIINRTIFEMERERTVRQRPNQQAELVRRIVVARRVELEEREDRRRVRRVEKVARGKDLPRGITVGW